MDEKPGPSASLPRTPPLHHLELFADPAHAKETLKALLHLIFFHRAFLATRPITREVLDLTLPAVDDVEIESLVEAKAAEFLDVMNGASKAAAARGTQETNTNGRGQVAVLFFEKRRKKTYTFFAKGDDELCWEQWMVDVTLARPRNESDAEKVRAAMEKSLQKAAMKVVTIAGDEKDHIPPILTQDTNPFPYQVVVNPKDKDLARPTSAGIGIF